jgi:Xaa-Pro aminopeptidase
MSKAPASAASRRGVRSPKRAKKAALPPGTPQALVDFMMRDWSEPRQAATAHPENSSFLKRREDVAARFPGEVVLVPTGKEKVRVNDTVHRFRPGSDFAYLTGNHEPDCVLVLEPRARGSHRHVLFVEGNPGRSDPTFFTDRHKGELWVGPRLSLEASRARHGVDETRPLTQLAAFVGGLRSKKRKFRLVRGLDPALDRLLPGQAKKDRELAECLSELRLVKDASEVRAIAQAAEATKRAFEAVIRVLPKAKSEREVEATFDGRARIEGNDVGFATIVAAGAHACTLHWTRNDGPLRSQELVLVDAGIEGHALYTADVTRTLPIGGRFSLAQRTVYELVLEAQRAALAVITPGADFLAPHRAASEVLARGLVRLGILRVTAEEALREDRQLYKRYTLHGTSHMLGLDVHDCASARESMYRKGKLAPGMVLTVEPGLYFQQDDLSVPRALRGIGVRIEDDVLVTATGYRTLTQEIPRETEAVEAWMRTIWEAEKS